MGHAVSGLSPEVCSSSSKRLSGALLSSSSALNMSAFRSSHRNFTNRQALSQHACAQIKSRDRFHSDHHAVTLPRRRKKTKAAKSVVDYTPDSLMMMHAAACTFLTGIPSPRISSQRTTPSRTRQTSRSKTPSWKRASAALSTHVRDKGRVFLFFFRLLFFCHWSTCSARSSIVYARREKVYCPIRPLFSVILNRHAHTDVYSSFVFSRSSKGIFAGFFRRENGIVLHVTEAGAGRRGGDFLWLCRGRNTECRRRDTFT